MCAAVTTTALGLGMSAYQAYQGNKDAKSAQDAIDSYDRQDLKDNNPYKAVQINTVGSDAMREENQRTSANTVDALRNMGVRGASMIPSVVASNNNANKETRSYLDNQIRERDYAIAGDDVNTRGMMENRENADLAGLGNAMQVGNQNAWSGFRGMANAGYYAANNVDFSQPRAEIDPITRIPTAGLIPTTSQLPSATLPDWSKIYPQNPI